ncbi:MAG: 3-deoxy-7-phosphoheptulonate synthase [Clostridiales bacterium]|nr:3-deoxy-7-phosphoheptulonate synthase [Clostridiales bacterium]
MPTAEELKAEFRPSASTVEIKAARDAEIRRIFLGRAEKLLLIIGPCSAHCPELTLEYVGQLAEVASEAGDKILIVPRVYTAKARSASMGFMGLIHAGAGGLKAARRLHLDVLEQTGLSTADELLYPALLPYFSDLVSYFAVGARSVLNQEHRLVASGLNLPVGMKNPLCGDLAAMQAAICAAKSPQEFIFRDNFVKTGGNPLAHGVLRGGRAPNYRQAAELDIPIIIDASHGNSGKNPLKQREVILDVLKNRPKNLKGFMIESFFEGASITDPCLNWPKTRDLICEIVEALE